MWRSWRRRWLLAAVHTTRFSSRTRALGLEAGLDSPRRSVDQALVEAGRPLGARPPPPQLGSTPWPGPTCAATSACSTVGSRHGLGPTIRRHLRAAAGRTTGREHGDRVRCPERRRSCGWAGAGARADLRRGRTRSSGGCARAGGSGRREHSPHDPGTTGVADDPATFSSAAFGVARVEPDDRPASRGRWIARRCASGCRIVSSRRPTATFPRLHVADVA